MSNRQIPDNTPILVGAGQYIDPLVDDAKPPFNSPMDLAAQAAKLALQDAQCPADAVDTIAVIRLFSDSAPRWKSAFGRSHNPPESIARRLGINVRDRIYSNASGSEPLWLMAELMQSIASGERETALLLGAEAIATERFARRRNLEDNWEEDIDLPMDERRYVDRVVCKEEVAAGLLMPAHFYALIENRQAWTMGHDVESHRQYMAAMFAPFSNIAARNPHSFSARRFSASELATASADNYSICIPYTRHLVASDSVNQAAAVLLTSAGKARELGIPPGNWITMESYAAGADNYLLTRPDPGTSQAMNIVLRQCLDAIDARAEDMSMLDIYSCFPSAVHAACEAMEIPTDGTVPLTVTGGLPFFGGPGNNYSMHALAEVAVRLRQRRGRAMVSANGGTLSKHAGAVLCRADDASERALAEGFTAAKETTPNQLETRNICESPETGTVMTYTVVDRREKPDRAIVLAKTEDGSHFLARSESPDLVAKLRLRNPIGQGIVASNTGEHHSFTLDESARR